MLLLHDVYWVSRYQDIREYLVQCTVAIYFYLYYNDQYILHRATVFIPDCIPSIIGPSLKSKRLVVGVRLVIIIKMIRREKKSASSLHLFFWEKLLLHTEVLYMSKKHTSLKKNTNWAKISHFWGKSFYFDM